MAGHNEAQAARNAEMAPEHLVLGLLAEPQGLAVKAVTEQGVTVDALREAARARRCRPPSRTPRNWCRTTRRPRRCWN